MSTLRVHDLTLVLEEAQQALDAIRSGEIDALVVSRFGETPRVFLLEHENSAHRALLETLAEGAVTVSAEGTILYTNNRFAELVQRPATAALGVSLGDLLVPNGQAILTAVLASARDGSTTREATLLRADGALVPVMLGARSIDGEPVTFTVVVTDLTALKKAEASLRKANEELEERVRQRTKELEQVNAALRKEIAERTRLAEELRATADQLIVADQRKDEFLSMLAHELRNPLAPILTATEMLRLTGGAEPGLTRYRSVIERQAKNLTRLVDDLLDVSRITRRKITLRMAKVEVRPIVESAVDATRALIESADHGLEVRLPSEPVFIEADPTRLEQIIVNLLNNAAKYTEPGGNIVLSVAVEGQNVMICVKDTGVGIGPDLLPHVFDLFVQGKRSLARSQGGLGIGLTLVKNLVDMHGGAVYAHSDGAGAGTEVRISLPLCSKPADTPSSMVETRTPTEQLAVDGKRPLDGKSNDASCRILVIEDDPDIADGMLDLLRLWGYQVEAVSRGEDAVAAFEKLKPHAAIVDVGLPGIDGYEVARQLRQHDGDGKRLLLIGSSGYGQERDRQRGSEAGFDHYFVKPISIDSVRDLLDRHRKDIAA